MIVPALLSRTRLSSQRYNQTTLLAQELSKLAKLGVDSELFARRQDALQQVETRGRQKPADNVMGNFESDSSASGLELHLIEDISTTSRAFSKWAAVLEYARAVLVWELTLAK